jgi:hypothetical protein
MRPRDRAAERLAIWLGLTVALIVLCHVLGLRFSNDRGDLLGARLALLGLVGAIATFQYGTWERLVQTTHERIHDPVWVQFAAEVERDQAFVAAGGAANSDLPAREAALAAWRAWRDEKIRDMRTDFLPHNRAVLTNYLAAAYCLLLSTIVDLAAVLLRVDPPLAGAIAAGALLGSVPPFIDAWIRYTRGLSGEFRGWEAAFTQAAGPPDGTAPPR